MGRFSHYRYLLSTNSIIPALVVFLAASVIVAIALFKAGGDPLALARIGTRFSGGNPQGTEGYDGQFVYYIAMNPKPEDVRQLLDVPAYRYRRILMPLLTKLLSFGNQKLIPWLLIVIGVISLFFGTWAVAELLSGWGFSGWYSLIYGLSAGLILALIVDLPEPLAFGLAAGGLLANERGKKLLAWILISLSIFAKEVTILFLAALLLEYIAGRRWKDLIGAAITAGVPFVLFQLWLWNTFGRPGIGSGGAMSTSFELIPFMGILRIGGYSAVFLLAMLLVFGPTIILPSIWGIINSARMWWFGNQDWATAGLFLNALAIAMMPFSTFRETGGLLRYAVGIILALVLFAAKYQKRRAMNYAVFWLVLNVFLLK